MAEKVHIRTYAAADKDSVLHLFRLNTPRYFAREEEQDLVHYLDHETEAYFIVESSGLIVGCGGYNLLQDGKEARISWDIFHPNYQEKGLGRMLLEHRIGKLKELKSPEKIIVRTSQMAYRFYEKNGFRLLEQQENYWAPGFDLYVMEYVS